MNHKERRRAADQPQGTAALVAAIAHHQAGRFAEAEACYRQVLAAQPRHPDILFNLGIVLRQQNRIEDAIATYREVIAVAPDHADAHYNLGNALMALVTFADAEIAYRQAIALKPDFAAAHYNRGNALSGLRRLEEAAAAYRKAVACQPDFASAHYHLGNTLKELGKTDEAIAAYRQAIVIKPDWAEAHSNLGHALAEQGRLDEAVAAQRAAVACVPGNAEFHYNLGKALQDQGALAAAAAAYRDAIARNPAHAGAHRNLGIVLTNQSLHEEAERVYREAARLEPGNAEAFSNLLLCLHYSASVSAEDIYRAHREWEARFAGSFSGAGRHDNDRTPARRLKIGYVSPDFREHSVAYFVEPLLAAHDRQAVEVFCYSDVARPDAVTARLRAQSDRWLSTVGMTDDALVQKIRADRIDILVDLAGHTAFNRLLTFARIPAPVQATWLGYPDTTGLSAIDWRLVDATTDPPGTADALASESLLRLDGGFLCYGGPRNASDPTELPALANDFVTFGSFNNPAKLSDATFNVWAALLRRLPRARLLLKGKPFVDAATRELYLSHLAARGVDAERVALEVWRAGSGEHLAQYARVDIALDPFPYNGTTTTCEALWMGVPVVTLRGERHSSRVGASLLSQIGQRDWIAESVDGYVEIAAMLAADRENLRALRCSLRATMKASPLCDSLAFARKMETAYRQMWRRWCAAAGGSEHAQ